MKLFIAILILIFGFQSFSNADDIDDFEIEGMSVGDSLLDFFSTDEIKKFINHKSSYNYINTDYVIVGITNHNQSSINLETYSDLGVTINKKDNKYKILSIAGQNYSFTNINDCNKKQKLIAKSIKEDALGKGVDEDIWQNDKWISGNIVVGKSMMHDFIFDDFSAVRIICYELNEEGKKQASWNVKLDVIINSKKFNTFLAN